MAETIQPKPTYEVRRMMENGGWAVILRTQDEGLAREKASAFQDLVRHKGAFVDLVEVR